MRDTLQLNEEDREKFRGALREYVDCMYRKDAENEKQKDIKTMLKDELNIKKGLVGKLAKIAYNAETGNTKANDEMEELIDLADELGFRGRDSE